jgi:Transcriptional regulator, AbiEi antitoxin
MLAAMAHLDPLHAAIRDEKGPRRWISELAARQHGVIAHRQLVAGGLSRSGIQRLIEAGWLHPLHKGIYAVGHRLVSWSGRCSAAVLACGCGALLSHQPAAGLWEVRRSSSSTLHVTVLRPPKGPRGVRVHHVRSLHPEDVEEIDGIPVTSLARTLLDCAEVLPVRQVIRMIEEAERRHVFDMGAVERLLARSHGRHGVKPLRAALAELHGEPPRVNSDWERDFLDFCDDHDIPRPELNVMVEGFEVDALWRDAKLVVELPRA